MLKKLAIITTHPIQYNAPLFRQLAGRKKIAINVFYTWGEKVLEKKFDPGFGQVIQWDIPLLDGYPHQFVENIATEPGSHHFSGIKNPHLLEKVKDWGADAILVFGWSFNSHLKCMRYFHKKIPVLFRGDSTLLDPETSMKSLVKATILRWVYRHVDIALFVGKANHAYFLRYGIKSDQLRFAPHAIDNARFIENAGTHQDVAKQLRETLGIKLEDTVFLFAGKMEPKKDPALLISAFLGLNQVNAHLIMVGNGVMETALKKVAATHANIHFLPFQNQSKMPSIYRLADVFVLPSCGPGETWGLAVNEAMACSKAILVSDRAGCATDLVETSKNGFIFTSKNQSDLEKKMKDFLVSKELSRRMGSASFTKINDWSIYRIAESIEAAVLNTKYK